MKRFTRHGFTAALMAATVCAFSASASADEQWRRIDFDADLTTYLVNLKQVEHNGDVGTLWELDAPGRTGISVGLTNYLLIKRVFQCGARTQHLDEIVLYRQLGAKPEKLAHPTTEYEVTPNSIDETEMKLACNGEQPAASVDYASVSEAVKKAFGDAVKLPREQSNKTLRGLGGMGGPPPSGGAGPGPGPAPSSGPRPPQ